MLIGKYNKSVIVTYIGVVFSLVAMTHAMKQNIGLGMIFLILAGICDLFDGKFANLFKRNQEEKAFGVQIDSLADMINFVAAPVVLAFCIGLSTGPHLVILSFYSLAAITRLAYFNIQAEGAIEPFRYYCGLPVTYAALIFPVLWLTSFWLQPNVFQDIYSVAILLVGLFFVMNIKIKKPRGIAYLFFIALAIGVITAIVCLGI